MTIGQGGGAGELNPGFPILQNWIEIYGSPSPGVARIENASWKLKWDERPGYGFSGATVVYHGRGLARFDVIITLWEPEHFAEWEVWSLLLQKKPTGIEPAVDVDHPILNSEPLNIRACVIEEVSQFRKVSPFKWEVTIKFLEWRKPVAVLVAAPQQSIPSFDAGAKGAEHTGNIIDRQDVQILDLNDRIAKEGG